MLSEAGRTRVEEAVREAETGTAGEIVVVLARQAGSYKSIPLVYALVGALATPWPLLMLTAWPAVRIFTLQALAASVLLALPAVFGLGLVPHRLKRARAQAAARREFRNRGMADTRGRTGILLYMAVAERYAEVIGDVTIADRVAEAEWRDVIDALVAGMAAGRIDEAMVAAVGRIGSILARHVPPGVDDRDELPNRIVVV